MLDNSVKFISTTSNNGTIFENYVSVLTRCMSLFHYLEFNVFFYVKNEK